MKNVCCDKVEQKSSRGDIEVASFDFYSRLFHILVDFTTYDTVHGEAVKNKKKKKY